MKGHLLNRWQEFDNSALTGPRQLADGRGKKPPHVFDAKGWKRLQETKP